MMQPNNDQLQADEATTQYYQIKRDKHPAVTLYWIAESEEHGRPVKLYGLNCIFCKRTLAMDFKGHIAMMINAPVALAEFSMAMTIRCKQCGQNYRLVTSEIFMG